jgi:AraC-like DNA-binding protein
MNEFGEFKVKSNERYIYHSYRKYNRILCVYDAGILYTDATYRHTRNPKYPDYLFEYIMTGKGYIEHGDKKYTVKAGDFVFIPKECNVTYYADKYEPYSKLWFTTDGELTGKLCEAFDLKNEVYIVKKKMYDKFQRFFFILEHEGFELERVAKHLLGIMIELVGAGNTQNSLKEDKDDPGLTDVEQIKAYIDTVVDFAPTVSQIAEYFGLCEATVIRRFKKEYGETPNQYIKKQRIKMAESLIRITDYSVTKISNLLNFCSQSYFSDMFYKEYGIYPTEYRRTLASKQEN